MASQNWQMGICRACPKRVQTYSCDLGRLSENQPGPASLVGKPKTWLAHCYSKLCKFFPMPLTLRRTPATTRYYIEALEGLGEAIPLQMLLIPTGTFMMGSPEDEPERQGREGPQHEVSVPSFFLGRYPVTQAQWRAVAALQQVNLELNSEPSNFTGDNLPVEQVSWYEAVEFCDRLSAHTGRPYRLPSEAEWEYACRAGTTTPFHFGKTLTTEVANYYGQVTYVDGPEGEVRKTTTPVD